MRPRRFILTGSTNVLTPPTLADSLAGRIGILRLHPLAQVELEGRDSGFVDRLFDADFRAHTAQRLGAELAERVVAGGYPAALARPSARRRAAWYRDYVEALVQRDVRDLTRIGSLDALPRLPRLASEQSDRLINVTALATGFTLRALASARQMCSFSACPGDTARGSLRMWVVGVRPDGTPKRPFRSRNAVLGCAPARLNCPVSPGLRHAPWSSRSARSRAVMSPSVSHFTSSGLPSRNASTRSGRANCAAPAQSSPTCEISAKALRADTWIREAVELHEDRALDGLADRRRASWSPKTAFTAAQVRAQLKLR